MVAGEIVPRSDSHHYDVIKFGVRMTAKYFSNLSSAVDYYDSLCKRNKQGYKIWLREWNSPNSQYVSRMVYSNDKNRKTPYRDVSKEKKSDTTGFGFPKPKKNGWPNVKV